jgi:Phage Mu protein F like protein.
MSHVDDLQRIIDKHSPQIGDQFFTWIADTLSDTDWDLFEAAIDSGDFSMASRLVQWSDYDPSALIGDTLGAAGQVNAEYISDITGTKYAFDLADPNAVKWAGEHGAELVQQIDEPTRAALKEVIHRGYFSGYTPREQAQYIKGMVGLDERRVKAVDNYMVALRRKGFSDEETSKKALKYSDKLLEQRAQTIAVNEASEAATRGQYFSTKDACSRGVLDPQMWEEYRIVTHDKRLCPICEPLSGEARRLPDGTYPSSGSVTPKLHVMCRCTSGLRKINTEEDMSMKGQIDEAVESSMDVVFEARGKETDESLFVPTVPIVEGVFEGRGLSGFAIL